MKEGNYSLPKIVVIHNNESSRFCPSEGGASEVVFRLGDFESGALEELTAEDAFE